MAMDLGLWAQINLIGHVSYADYLNMDDEEARACYMALKNAIEQAKGNQGAQSSFDELCDRYGG